MSATNGVVHVTSFTFEPGRPQVAINMTSAIDSDGHVLTGDPVGPHVCGRIRVLTAQGEFLFDPVAPDARYKWGITNTAAETYLSGPTGGTQPRSARDMEYLVYELADGRLIGVRWGGPRGKRTLVGEEVTLAQVAAEYHRDGLQPPPGLELPSGKALIPVGAHQRPTSMEGGRRIKEPDGVADLPKPTVDAPPLEPAARKTKRGRMGREDANRRAMELAEENPAFLKGSLREWAEAILCSDGQVAKLPLWRETMRRTGRGRADVAPAPKVVSLTPHLEAVTGAGEPEEVLRQLIAEQEADQEPSPLEDDPPSRRRKVHSRKRL